MGMDRIQDRDRAKGSTRFAAAEKAVEGTLLLRPLQLFETCKATQALAISPG
jgi:hypothetical protein